MKKNTYFCIIEVLCIISFVILCIFDVTIGYNFLAFLLGMIAGLHLSSIYYEQYFGRAWGSLSHKKIAEDKVEFTDARQEIFEHLPDFIGPGIIKGHDAHG